MVIINTIEKVFGLDNETFPENQFDSIQFPYE